MNGTAFPPPPGNPTQGRATQVLAPDECWSLLRAASVGRLAFVVDGWPVVLPVNFILDEEDIFIRTATGTKLASARGAAQVSLQADSTDSVYRSGWSVLVFGLASEITEAAELIRVSLLAPSVLGRRRQAVLDQDPTGPDHRSPPAAEVAVPRPDSMIAPGAAGSKPMPTRAANRCRHDRR